LADVQLADDLLDALDLQDVVDQILFGARARDAAGERDARALHRDLDAARAALVQPLLDACLERLITCRVRNDPASTTLSGRQEQEQERGQRERHLNASARGAPC